MTTPQSRRTFALAALLTSAVTLGIVIGRLSGVERGSTDPLGPPASSASPVPAALRDAPSAGREELAAIVSAAEPEASLDLGASPDATLEIEPWKAFRLQELEDRWRIVQQEIEAGVSDPQMSISFLIQISVRPCADQMGLGTLLPQGVITRTEARSGMVSMTAGSPEGTLKYEIPEGLFPALDYWARTRTELDDRQQESQNAALAASMRPPGRPFFPVDDVFLRDLEALKEQARLALLARRDAY